MSETTVSTPTKKPRVALLVATGFGLGYLPLAPGTWGSLAGVAIASLPRLLAYGLKRSSLGAHDREGLLLAGFGALILVGYVFGVILISLEGVRVAQAAENYFRRNDPTEVVIDEISGQLITFIPILTVAFEDAWWKYLVAGFILFRVFDIWKPYPIRRVEKWPGGWGIMADDWIAGVYAAAVLWFVHWMRWMG